MSHPSAAGRFGRRRILSLLGSLGLALVVWAWSQGAAREAAVPWRMAEPPAAGNRVAERPRVATDTGAPPEADPERADVAAAPSNEVGAQPSSRELLRAALPQLIARHAPDLRLSSGQLESLIDSMERARTAYEEIAMLDDTPGNAARIAALRETAEHASAESRAIVGFDSSSVLGVGVSPMAGTTRKGP